MDETMRAGKAAHLKSPIPCEPKAQTLTELLQQAADGPDALYVNLLDTQNAEHPLTYREVLAGARKYARFLLRRGVPRHGRVALLLPTSQEFLWAFFGTQMAGAVPVPFAFPLALGPADPYVMGFERIVASAQPALLLTVVQMAAAAGRLMASIGRAEQVAVPADIGEPEGSASFPALSADDPALVQYTSGSVTEPTGAALSHRQVLCNVYGLGIALDLKPDDVALTWVPLVHDMGLVGGLLTSLYWRCPLVVMPPQSFLMHPHLWLKNIADHRVTISAAPNFAYQLCVRRVRDKHLEGLDLSRWRAALTGSETVQPATVEAFCERFRAAGFKAQAILPTYGLAENTLATACPSLTEPYVTKSIAQDGAPARPFASVGHPLAGQELAILAEQGEVLCEGEVGEIVVRGPCVMSGYCGNPQATERALAGGWLHTGDLGIIAEGRLYIIGRKKQMVIKMGRNYYPQDIEQVVRASPGWGGGDVLALAAENATSGTEDLVLYAETVVADAEAEKRLNTEVNAELLARLGIRADRIVLVAPGSLRKTASRYEERSLMRQRLKSEPAS